ncbi:MAG: hypothetical protein ACRC10_06840 [Thermoguttaceae bacterium]
MNKTVNAPEYRLLSGFYEEFFLCFVKVTLKLGFSPDFSFFCKKVELHQLGRD